jgi:hypothetical protein
MWVFGLYEFLRTWRQRARLLIQFEESYNKLAAEVERGAYLKDIVDKAKNKARLATRFPVYYPEHVAKIADFKFMKSVRAYCNTTDQLYEELSAVRMPAAKHELPKKHAQEALIADAPGIGLPDPLMASIRWQVLLGEKQTTIMRRNLAAGYSDGMKILKRRCTWRTKRKLVGNDCVKKREAALGRRLVRRNISIDFSERRGRRCATTSRFHLCARRIGIIGREINAKTIERRRSRRVCGSK